MSPPPANVIEDSVWVNVIVDVPELSVRPVVVPVCQTLAPEPLKETVDDPRLITRVFVLLDEKEAAVTLKLFVVNVPTVSVIIPVVVSASCIAKAMPVELLIVMAHANDFPAVVMVAAVAAEKVIVPEYPKP